MPKSSKSRSSMKGGSIIVYPDRYHPGLFAKRSLIKQRYAVNKGQVMPANGSRSRMTELVFNKKTNPQQFGPVAGWGADFASGGKYKRLGNKFSTIIGENKSFPIYHVLYTKHLRKTPRNVYWQ